MERPSFLSPSAPDARKNVRARLAARKENVTPPDAVAAALKARHEPGEALGDAAEGRSFPSCAGRQVAAAARGRRRGRRGRVRGARALRQGVAPGARGHKAPRRTPPRT